MPFYFFQLLKIMETASAVRPNPFDFMNYVSYTKPINRKYKKFYPILIHWIIFYATSIYRPKVCNAQTFDLRLQRIHIWMVVSKRINCDVFYDFVQRINRLTIPCF